MGSSNANKGYDVRDLKLAERGRDRIAWAERDMPVTRMVRERFSKKKPLEGLTVGACLHVTSETAVLMRTLKAGGARVFLCASNPMSTQDDTAAALVKYERIPTFAIRGEDSKVYYRHLRAVLDQAPVVTFDDGADLVSMIHKDYRDLMPQVRASMEETTTGVIRLKAMAKDGVLGIPVVAVNDADTKHLFDNRYGTGQSTLDGILRATNVLLAGRTVVVAGYGWCGKGVASRARGLGANVIVTEVNAIRALEAAMDGFSVRPMREAAKVGDIFISVTGDKDVITREHFRLMKDGAILCNSGHFDVEVDVRGLEKMAKHAKRGIRDSVDGYQLADGRWIYLLGGGRLVNLTAAEGHPSAVMDMSFATQALTAEWVSAKRLRLPAQVHKVPVEVEEQVASLKLASMGIRIDRLSPEQKRYLNSWQEGT